jgi:DNA-binding MarR family transcriptional regulator
MVHEIDPELQRTAGGALERMFDLAVVLSDLMNEHLSRQGLTPARAEVLWLLNQTGPLTQRALSRTLKCSPRNVTGLVDILESAGFVARNPHPTDRRAILVTLTRRGKRVATDWQTGQREGADQLFNGVTATELNTFSAVLDRILERLRTQASTTTTRATARREIEDAHLTHPAERDRPRP